MDGQEAQAPDIVDAFYAILGEFFTTQHYVQDPEGNPVPEEVTVATSLLSIAQSLHQQSQIQLEILKTLQSLRVPPQQGSDQVRGDSATSAEVASATASTPSSFP